MPAAPRITFPGVQAVVSARITRSHGTAPQAMILNIAPQNSVVKQTGDLVVSYEGIELTIPDCIVDQTSFQFDTRRRIISLLIFDRRWKWIFGEVSGHYNRRNDAGDIIKAEEEESEGTVIDTERRPQQLAKLLLEQMKEEEFEVDKIPDELRPESEWETSNPALELGRLCDLLKCRVVLGWDNKVRLWPLAEGEKIQRKSGSTKLEKVPVPSGKKLPTNLPIIRTAVSVDTAERPDSIAVRTAPVVHQFDFELEAVGEDKDGSIKLLADLDIAPDKTKADGGWFTGGHFAGRSGWFFADDDIFQLANKSILKWFRIKVPFTFPSDPELQIDKLDQIKPILPYLAKSVVEEGRRTTPDPIVYGRWYDDSITKMANTIAVTEKFLPLVDEPTGTESAIVPGGFTIDADRAIVKFASPIWAQDKDGKSTTPDLRLRACFNYRNANGSWFNAERVREQPEPHLGTEPLYLNRPELIPVKRVTYPKPAAFTNTTIKDNLEEIRDLADKYIDAAEKQFKTETPTMVQYAGFYPIELDGNIRTVSFEFDATGLRPITTTVYWNQDVGHKGSVSYEAMRHEQRLLRIMNRTGLSSAEKKRLERETRK